MIYIKIELWPMGCKERAYVLGEAEISNDGTGTGTARYGNYDVKLSKFEGFKKGIWKRGKVEQHDRVKRGPWDLLFKALREIVGMRNR